MSTGVVQSPLKEPPRMVTTALLAEIAPPLSEAKLLVKSVSEIATVPAEMYTPPPSPAPPPTASLAELAAKLD